MEPLIVETTPKGSAILAYGKSRGPRWNPKLLAIVAGCFGILALMVVGFWYIKTRVMLPTDRLLVVAIRPATIGAVIGSTQRQDLPAPWRAAIETGSIFNAFLGISLDEHDSPHPFALVTRTATVVGGSNLRTQPQGAFILLTTEREQTLEEVPLSQLMSVSRRMRRSQAAWTVRGDLLKRLSALSIDGDETHSEIRGTWNGRSGHVDVSVDQPTRAESFNAPMFVVLGETRTDATPVLDGLLSQGVDVRTIVQSPTAIGLDPSGEHILALSWDDTLELRDRSLLDAARGLGPLRNFTLPDETVVSEFHLGTTAGAGLEGGSMLFIGDVASSTFALSPAVPVPDPHCPGTIRFHLEGPALQGVLTAWNIPASWKSAIQRIKLTEDTNGADICIN